jgi:catechol-2,3-dioxygenase
VELHHLAIRARDVAVVAAFYRDVLGLEVVPAPRPGVAWLRVGSGLLMVEPADAATEPRGDRPSDGLFLIALRIAADSRARWRARLTEHGVGVTHETAFTLYVLDPEGNRVGLSHWPDDAGQLPGSVGGFIERA